MRARRAVVGMAVAALVATACGGHPAGTALRPGPSLPPIGPPTAPPGRPAGTGPVTPPGEPVGPAPAPVRVARAALTPFSSCSDFLAAVRSEAASEVTAWGLPGSAMGSVMAMPDVVARQAMAAAPAPAAGAAQGGPATGFSTTNNQVAGIDEPDTAKTDGHLLVTLHGGGNATVLSVVELGGGAPRQGGSITLAGGASGLFLIGTDAVVLGTTWAPPVEGAALAPSPRTSVAPQTSVRIVNLTQPGGPRLARTFAIDGTEVAARLIGPSVKLVVSGGPRIAFGAEHLPDTDAAVAANRAAVAAAPLEAWLPSVTDAGGGRHVADCARVEHPSEPSGLGTVSVLSIDPSASEPGPAVTVLGNAGTVYAGATDLYVATTSFAVQQAGGPRAGGPAGRQAPGPAEGARTLIHDFAIADPKIASYLASGTVPGTVLNQYSLSEYGPNLRVATTVGFPTPPPGEGRPVPVGAVPEQGSQSIVTVLHRVGGTLDVIGQVGGLGRGERIYGVRFIGPLGYVVTFRQLDPLYVVDLSDPSHPAVRGALELSGYSAYLHPVGPGLLLGVGAAADDQAHRLGVQVSLFGVGDPANPTLVGKEVIAGGSAAVESDPHAFLWWAPAGLVVLPVSQFQPSGVSFAGAVILRVDPAKGVSEVGRITHDRAPLSPPPARLGAPAPGAAGPVTAGAGEPVPAGRAGAGKADSIRASGSGIKRALVIGNRLFTTSERGVLVSDLATLADISWLPYP